MKPASALWRNTVVIATAMLPASLLACDNLLTLSAGLRVKRIPETEPR
jgi:hypothetical protein